MEESLNEISKFDSFFLFLLSNIFNIDEKSKQQCTKGKVYRCFDGTVIISNDSNISNMENYESKRRKKECRITFYIMYTWV